MGWSGPTTDHDEIRRWVEAHDGAPAEVAPFVFDSEPAVLKMLFGKAKQGTTEIHPISWDAFFAQFDLLGLTFVYVPDRPLYELLQIEAKSAYKVVQDP